MGEFVADRRAVSSLVGYALKLAVVTGFVIAVVGAQAMITREQRAAQRHDALERVGQELAGRIERVDRLTRAGSGSGLRRVTVDFPTQVAGTSYRIRVLSSADAAASGHCGPPADEDGVGCLLLFTGRFGTGPAPVDAYYALGSGTTVETTSVRGGRLFVEQRGPTGDPITVRRVS